MTGDELFRGRLILAPMSRGTDLPFRRLAREHGAEVVVGEMAYAHKIARDVRSELPLLRRHAEEGIFGVQLAGKKPEVMAEAARIAADLGADFVDVNLGCPIQDTTRRGFGAALMRRPGRVGAIVEAMTGAVEIPVTVKLRLGWSSEKPTFLRCALAAQEAGAAAATLHARSRAQRYRRPADWDRVTELVQALSIPVIGNGDIFDGREARRRMAETGCASVMAGRWALAKPWIFREFEEDRLICPDTDERVALLRRYVELCLEHHGEDEKGRRRVRRFLGFHQDFFRRFRPGQRHEGVNSDDPRDWGEGPRDDVEEWLCRADLDAVEALCDWLVDGAPAEPPPPPAGGEVRAVKTEAYG